MLALLKIMVKECFRPDKAILCATFNSCEKAKYWAVALELLQDCWTRLVLGIIDNNWVSDETNQQE